MEKAESDFGARRADDGRRAEYVTRRGLLGGAAALVACLMSKGARAVFKAADAAEPLPDYYAPHLAAVAAKVNARAGQVADAFWFITDLHITANRRRSGKAIAALAGLVPSITKTLVGGDFPEAFGAKFETDRLCVDYAVDYYRLFWKEPIEGAGVKVYTAKGNHDFTVRHDAQTPAGFTYSGVDARKIIMDSAGCREVVTNPDDPEACYYYFDNAAARVRYIVADTTDSITSSRPYWAVQSGMHETQLRWLADNAVATLPIGWYAVVMHHIPIQGVVGNTGEMKLYAPFRELLEAYQSRGRTTLCGKEYDFADARGRILMDITGHHHAERQTFVKGILHVTEPCDAAYSDYIVGSAPWCGDLPSKRAGAVTEQTFDAVQIDLAREMVYFTRVGGGQDRAIHTRAREVKVGEKCSFTGTQLTEPVTWACYDGDRVTYKRNPKNRYTSLVEYHNDYATMAADGTLIALKPGPVMVLAMDAARNKEIFPVTVV